MFPKWKSGFFLFLFNCFFLFPNSVLGQVNVNANITAWSLAQNVAGKGVTILNPVLKCPSRASGIFTTINGGVGLDSGIVLTTGYAATMNGFNGINGPSGNLASCKQNTNGDASLTNLAGQVTYDACALEFDFIPKSDSITFRYVFSSEEYISATCGPYNDAFAFFISGPGIVGQKNIALVPGTNIPVAINSINSGVPGNNYSLSNCQAMGAGSPFTNYYVNNANGPYITHRGFTTVLNAASAVLPCSTYHLKMVIADAGNALYDSGVFVESGSLQSGSNLLSLNANTNSLGQKFIVKTCASTSFTINRLTPKNYAQTYKLTYSGTAVQGVDVSTLPDSLIIPAGSAIVQTPITGLATPLNGLKTLTIKLHSPYVCDAPNTILDSVTLYIYDSLSVKISTSDTVLCKGDSINLKVQGEDIVQYTWSPNAAISNNKIKSPQVHPSVSTKYVVIGTLPGSGCNAKKDSIFIKVDEIPTLILKDEEICQYQSILLQAQISPAYFGYQYVWSGPNGFQSIVAQPMLNNPSRMAQGMYHLIVKTDTSICQVSGHLQLTINSPEAPTVVGPIQFCHDSSLITLEVEGQNLLWYQDVNGVGQTQMPVLYATNLGFSTVYVSQTLGQCESDRMPINIVVKNCCDGTIFIPSAFTPNGDGRNDTWSIQTGLGYTIIQVNVVNRWGENVFYATSNMPWDGSFKGQKVESGNYFYQILAACKNGTVTSIKGDVLVLY